MRSTGCPVEAVLDLLSGRWTSYILWLLRLHGPMRFGVLKRKMPEISSKVLTERLRLLEEENIIYREYEPTVPPSVTYGLASRGRELEPLFDRVSEIGHRWREEDLKKGAKT